jgi:hypothetical protein
MAIPYPTLLAAGAFGVAVGVVVAAVLGWDLGKSGLMGGLMAQLLVGPACSIWRRSGRSARRE